MGADRQATRAVLVEVQFAGPQPSAGCGALLCLLLGGSSVEARPVELPRGRKRKKAPSEGETNCIPEVATCANTTTAVRVDFPQQVRMVRCPVLRESARRVTLQYHRSHEVVNRRARRSLYVGLCCLSGGGIISFFTAPKYSVLPGDKLLL